MVRALSCGQILLTLRYSLLIIRLISNGINIIESLQQVLHKNIFGKIIFLHPVNVRREKVAFVMRPGDRRRKCVTFATLKSLCRGTEPSFPVMIYTIVLFLAKHCYNVHLTKS